MNTTEENNARPTSNKQPKCKVRKELQIATKHEEQEVTNADLHSENRPFQLGTDCGIFAIYNAVLLHHGCDPSNADLLNVQILRKFLALCFDERGNMKLSS